MFKISKRVVVSTLDICSAICRFRITKSLDFNNSKHKINVLSHAFFTVTKEYFISRHNKSIFPNSPFAKILPSQTPPDPYLALSFWPHTHLDFRVHSRPSEYLSHQSARFATRTSCVSQFEALNLKFAIFTLDFLETNSRQLSFFLF